MDEPTPDSPVPPRPPEAAKVQPKKETVRIALPPKPTAAPTIKLPSLPPTGAAPTAARPASAPAAAATAQVPRPPSPPTAAAAKAPGTSVAKPPAPAPAKAPMPPPARPAASARTVGSLDTALAVVAMVIGIAALVSVLLLVMGDFGSIK